MGYTSVLYSGLLILSELVIFRNLLPGVQHMGLLFVYFCTLFWISL